MRHRGAAFLVAVFIVTIAAWSADAEQLSDVQLSDVVAEVRGVTATATTLVAATTSSTPVVPTTTTAPVVEEIEEDELAAVFTDSINVLRASEGMGELRRDGELDALAQSWAEAVAAEATLRHSELIYQVIEGDWFAAGENLALGPTPVAMFAGLEASAPHRENMVNADYSHLGVGIVVSGRTIWTVHLFAG